MYTNQIHTDNVARSCCIICDKRIIYCEWPQFQRSSKKPQTCTPKLQDLQVHV